MRRIGLKFEAGCPPMRPVDSKMRRIGLIWRALPVASSHDVKHASQQCEVRFTACALRNLRNTLQPASTTARIAHRWVGSPPASPSPWWAFGAFACRYNVSKCSLGDHRPGKLLFQPLDHRPRLHAHARSRYPTASVHQISQGCAASFVLSEVGNGQRLLTLPHLLLSTSGTPASPWTAGHKSLRTCTQPAHRAPRGVSLRAGALRLPQ